MLSIIWTEANYKNTMVRTRQHAVATSEEKRNNQREKQVLKPDRVDPPSQTC